MRLVKGEKAPPLELRLSERDGRLFVSAWPRSEDVFLLGTGLHAHRGPDWASGSDRGASWAPTWGSTGTGDVSHAVHGVNSIRFELEVNAITLELLDESVSSGLAHGITRRLFAHAARHSISLAGVLACVLVEFSACSVTASACGKLLTRNSGVCTR